MTEDLTEESLLRAAEEIKARKERDGIRITMTPTHRMMTGAELTEAHRENVAKQVASKLRPVDGLWPIERVCIPELAMLMFEGVTGRHPADVTDAERDKWIKAMERVCDALASSDNVRLYP